MVPPIILAAGDRFYRLTVVERDGPQPSGEPRLWVCRCDCGEVTRASSYNLRSGRVRSCGCLNQEQRRINQKTHGEAPIGKPTKLYRAWRAMINRCEYEPSRAYAYYGGRGIRVCDRWRNDYLAFKADMGEPPTSAHTLDRIDSDGHYEPGNVRWATRLQQANNKRNNRAKRGLPPDRRKEKRDAQRGHI